MLWFLLCGLALGQLITGVLLCLTIIGLPLGLANLKLIPVPPVGLPRAMRTILTLLIVVIGAAPAQAARALAVVHEHEGFALAGNRVLYAQTQGRTVRVLSVPLKGGTARRLLTHRVKPGRFAHGEQLVASPKRAALLVAAVTKDGELESTQLLAGTPTGGWNTLIPERGSMLEAPFPSAVQLAGDDVVSFEISRGEDALVTEVALYDPARRVLPLPQISVLAGDFAASVEHAQMPEVNDNVSVVNWRTGQQLSVAEFPDSVVNVELDEDGRAIVTTTAKALYAVRPGGAVEQLADDFEGGLVVGDRVLSYDHDGIRVQDADGSTRRFGVRTHQLGRVIANERHVLWRANDCLLVARITDLAAREPGPGPCARSELTVGHRKLTPKGNTNFELRCVFAPANACRGRLEVRAKGAIVASANVSVAVGERRELIVQLTKAARSKLTRAGRQASITLRPNVGSRQTLVTELAFWRP